jgi:hypothetical protein
MTREERMLHGAYNVGGLDKAIKYVSLAPLNIAKFVLVLM